MNKDDYAVGVTDSKVVDLSGEQLSEMAMELLNEDDQSEMEHAIQNVAEAVCTSWEVFGNDVHQSVVTDVDGHMVRITVSVEVM